MKVVSEEGIKINKNCRICNSTNLKNVIDLGNQALTGVFIEDGKSVGKYNMSLSMCQDCGLTQINEVYDLDLLYGDGYGYESALNASMIEGTQMTLCWLISSTSLTISGLLETMMLNLSGRGFMLDGRLRQVPEPMTTFPKVFVRREKLLKSVID